MKDYTTRYIAAALLIIALIGWGLTPVQAAETAPVVAATASTVTLESSLVSIIQSVQSGVQSGVAFLSEEIPDVLRQLILWKATYYGMWAVLQLFCVYLGVKYARRAVEVVTVQMGLEAASESLKKSIQELRFSKSAEEIAEETAEETAAWQDMAIKLKDAEKAAASGIPKVVVSCCLGGLALLVGLGAVFNVFGNILQVTQLLIAPKVWLIEYAATLMK